jgi:hypothetical protein
MVGSAIAPEQYIAISTARGFIGTDDDDCFAIFEAYERLDFFTVFSPPASRDHVLFYAPTSTVDSLQAVSETGSRPILPPLISKCKRVEALKLRLSGSLRHFTLDIGRLMHAAFLKPVAKRPPRDSSLSKDGI